MTKFIVIVLIFTLFIITGCSIERENNDNSQETEIQLQPIMIPDGKGHLHLTMMPRAVPKGE